MCLPKMPDAGHRLTASGPSLPACASSVAMARAIGRIVACCVVVLSSGVTEAAERPRSVLMIEQSDGIGPFYVSIFSGLRSTLNGEASAPITLYTEHLDLGRFSGEAYEASLKRHLQAKYTGRPIGVVVAMGGGALDFALRHRLSLWPETPIVFAFTDDASIKALSLPDNITGKTLRVQLKDMVSAAQQVVPDLAHVAIVGDSLDTQPPFRRFVEEIPIIARQLDVIDLTGLPMVDVRKRIAALPERTAILYTAIYSDGKGTYFTPAEALPMIAEVANRPIIASVESYIGRGAVGGYVSVAATIGSEAARTALAIIDGRPASTIPISEGSPPRPVFDWRQLQRWGVDERRLPKDSEIRYRVLPIWRQYPLQTASIVAILLFQSGLIAALLYQYRRRRRAEVEARAHLNALAHVNRYAIAGELSASIAHQLNQPLGAVLANAEAAELLLQSPAPDIREIKEILVDIKRDNLRASGVIAGLRRLLKKADAEMLDVDLNQIVDEVFRFVAVQASEAQVDLVRILEPALRVRGDAIQLQQVVLNLMINAIEAVREAPAGQRTVIGQTRRIDTSTAEISIADTGPGIAEENIKRIFEPFYSTKQHGMGMGLSIARTIVERHGGWIRAENREGGGSLFCVGLPLLGSGKEAS